MRPLLNIKVFVFVIKLILLIVVVGGVVYWLRFSSVNVSAYKVIRGTVANEVMGTGTLEARVNAAISPKISGLLVDVLVDQNDRVTKGQLLAQLDDTDFRHQVEVAKADLAAAKATVKRIESEIAGAQASAIKARENFERITVLRKSHVVAQNEMEQATESHDVAEANFSKTLASKIEAERAVEKAEASLRLYDSRLMDTKICAPFNALVIRRNRNPGDVVVPGVSILDVVSTSQLWISAWVDETAMGMLSTGQPARIVFRSAPEVAIQGKVARLGSETDRETREFLVDVDVLQLPKKWAVGQRAEVYIETERRDGVLFVPQRFIVWRDGKSGVMVNNEGKAQWRKITLGLRGKDIVEVTEGLMANDTVIGALPGAELPHDGRAVRNTKP
jgi:HlyD family secretion protein